MHLQPLDISSKPTLEYIDSLVVTHMAAKWEYVAIYLGVDSCVNESIARNHHTNCERACHDMLERWLARGHHTGEQERTWCTLLTALSKAGYINL